MDLLGWDKVNRPKKISHALIFNLRNPEAFLPWPSCARNYKNGRKKKKKIFRPLFLETKIPSTSRVQGRDCLKLMGRTSKWALNNNGPFLIRDVKCKGEWLFSKLLG